MRPKRRRGMTMPDNSPPTMAYILEREETVGATGYFATVPESPAPFSVWIDYLRSHPLDQFLRKHLVRVLQVLPADRVAAWIEETGSDDPVFRSLLCESAAIGGRFAHLLDRFSDAERRELSRHTPLIPLRSIIDPASSAHGRWVEVFRKNIESHQPLPAPDEVDAPPDLFPEEMLSPYHRPPPPVDRLRESVPEAHPGPADPPPSLAEIGESAVDRLTAVGALAGPEMRHTAALSPWGLLREWRVSISVDVGRHRYTLSGPQTAYGRGLSLDAARTACAMEIVERFSAFASIGPGGLEGFLKDHPLRYGTVESLRREGLTAIDPDELGSEVSCRHEPLYWVAGETPDGGAAWVPVQSVIVFPNLDEVSLLSAAHSTGLASGTTPDGAKRSALLETIERDAEATVPFDPADCFALTADGGEGADLLGDLHDRGIDVRFRDLSRTFGIPCYQAFVISPDGEIIRGAGADLDGRRAVLSALTETPYPYPSGPPSRPAPGGLPVRSPSDLPDLSTGTPAGDVALIEAILADGGRTPVYVDLTRSDLGFPVVRAVVPGLAPMADFGRFSRIPPGLFARYLDAVGR